MIQVDTCSTPELLIAGNSLFEALGRCMNARRRRDRASDIITDLFLIIDALAKRLGVMEWNERVQASDDEEDDQDHEQRHEVSLSEALSVLHQEIDDSEIEYDDLAEANRHIHALMKELAAKPLEIIRGIIRYTTHGCTSADQVTKKWLALVRRSDPDSLRDMGTSQTAVARVLGERRATTCAREKREFEKPMKRSGARGWHGTGGLRSQENRDNCARAQKGNRNRATGHARQASEEVSGIPETNATRKKTKPKS